MERIGVRELRQHASRYLARVKTGQTVEVTERGRLIALLVPPTRAQDARARLIAAGRLIPGAGQLGFPSRVVAARGTSVVLDELRADRS